MSAILSARGVTLTLGGALILDGVDLDVAPGEVVALVGPNGAGKSTLLAALAGDLAPDSGVVRLADADLRAERAADLARVRAVQLQETRISFAFTVLEVVRMGRAPWHGTAHADADGDVVAQSLRIAELEDLAPRRYPTLSGGEKARTSFARVLAQHTAVLFLDEPTAALDIRHQEAVLREVRRRADGGVAVVVVLHDLTLAAAHADRVVLLDGGRVRADGPPRAVLTPELLTLVYRHPVAVIDHPASPGPVVLPVRHPALVPSEVS
ncbi:ABC transporter related [Beutenbergia cavernae DSM 12333]|uniref:ABC transporter related n=1 Tax=Beutenbergia cavernae (strain ATCC BAA-8 / DSM 12333 / CCUG 43141 / JCM 11478 / NBRC 16432 / NCIMB 13614 / HKI 0122) TaxID=471853 RepID=C5C4J5_BEUC1|nr:heme ABC transporter ATP-binding protein [Beutenbergia cavernae]ACQ82119.1 ABC transporter related [Beutenbergia cavernae DSM 12333]